MEYKIGSVITYQPFGGGLRRVRVTEKSEDIKNGRAGFDGVLVVTVNDHDHVTSDRVWGYDSQIISVEQF